MRTFHGKNSKQGYYHHLRRDHTIIKRSDTSLLKWMRTMPRCCTKTRICFRKAKCRIISKAILMRSFSAPGRIVNPIDFTIYFYRNQIENIVSLLCEPGIFQQLSRTGSIICIHLQHA